LSISTATVTEYTIRPGDPLLVLGTLRESVPISAANRGLDKGYISAEAADLQRREQLETLGIPARELKRTDTEPPPKFNLHPNVILADRDDEPFVLSREAPQRIIAGLARSSVLGIWGGPALALFSLGLLMKWVGLW
jgi:hypothetical protein